MKGVFVALFLLTITLGGYLIYSQYQNLKNYEDKLISFENRGILPIDGEKNVLGEKIQITTSDKNASSKTNAVADIITRYTDEVSGDVSVYYKNIATDETILVNGEKEYYMASLYKLVVTLFVLEYEQQGKLKFTDPIGSPPLSIQQALTRIITESSPDRDPSSQKKR